MKGLSQRERERPVCPLNNSGLGSVLATSPKEEQWWLMRRGGSGSHLNTKNQYTWETEKDCLYDNNLGKGEKLNSRSESLQSLQSLILALRRRDCSLKLRAYVPPGQYLTLFLRGACLGLGKIKQVPNWEIFKMPHVCGDLRSWSTQGAMKAANVPKLQFVIPACWQTESPIGQWTWPHLSHI